MATDDPRADDDGLSQTQPSARAPQPTRLLHYELLGLLGQGGMGAVYKARDERLGRIVALKRVTPAAATDGTTQQRLLLEARAASALTHPNIVTVYTIEESPEGAFIVMEYLEGESLEARLGRGPLSAEEVVRLGVQMADALACAHAAGLIHRDIKPANILLTARGAKLLDFGVAKQTATAPGAGLTQAGAIVGTWPYMSPEQLRGLPLDGRSDLFSLGGVLYEAATGQRPFPADDLATLLQRITLQAPVAPRLLVPGLPESLERTLLRTLEKDPARRFATASALATALRSPSAGPPPSSISRLEPAPSSVAVLAFRDLSAEGDQGYLCDGIAEELVTALSSVSGLRVAARSTSIQLKPVGLDARAAGERIGVGTVLEGAVRKSGDRLRVTVQLVDVVGGDQRWSSRFDGVVSDVFSIQDEIAAGVVKALRGILTAETRDQLRRPETTPEAYEHFLRGRQQIATMSVRSLLAAEEALQRAVAADGAYAPAHAVLAFLYADRAEWFGGGEAARQAADASSARAVSLGPSLVESHVARGRALAMRGDYAPAEDAYQTALRLNARSFDAHYHYARLCFQTGRDAQAAALFQKSAELQPDDFQSLLLASTPLERLGRADEAEASLVEGLRRTERVLALDPHNARALALGAASYAPRDRAHALELAHRALGAWPDDPMVLINVACTFAVLGEKEPALTALEASFGRGYGKRDWVLHDPDYDSLRGDPRFEALIAKLS